MNERKIVEQSVRVPVNVVEFDSGNKYAVLDGLEDLFPHRKGLNGESKGYIAILESLLSQEKEPENDCWFFLKLDRDNKVILNEFFNEDEDNDFSIDEEYGIFYYVRSSSPDKSIIKDLNGMNPSYYLAGKYVEESLQRPYLELSVYQR